MGFMGFRGGFSFYGDQLFVYFDWGLVSRAMCRCSQLAPIVLSFWGQPALELRVYGMLLESKDTHRR